MPNPKAFDPLKHLFSHVTAGGHEYITRQDYVLLSKRDRLYRFTPSYFTAKKEAGEVYFDEERGIIAPIKAVKDSALIAQYYKTVLPELKIRSSEIPYGLSPSQGRAYAMLSLEPRGVLTGPAGTGKTFLLQKLNEHWQDAGLVVRYAAPTGQAAKLLRQRLGVPASTVHSLVGWRGDSDKNKFVPDTIYCDLLVVDEASMLDTAMMSWLAQVGSDSQCRILLVGDHYQLPPVDAGDPFKDIILNQLTSVHLLTEVQRQAEDSPVIQLAHAYLQCKDYPVRNHFRVKQVRSARDLEDVAVDHYLQLHETSMMMFSPLRNKDFAGSCNSIGDRVSRELYGDRQGRYTVGDHIIFRATLWDSERKLLTINGTHGKILEFSAKSALVERDDGISQWYPFWQLSRSTAFGYCTTVHQAQGSEAGLVIFLLPKSRMYSRRLIYTGITRAKEDLIFLGNLRYLGVSPQKDERKTLLPLLYKKPLEELQSLSASRLRYAWETVNG